MHLIFKDFETIIINILNGSNTWIKTKKSFILNGYEYSDIKSDTFIRVHIPFKLSFEQFTFTNLLIDFPLTLEQRKILLKAFMSVSNIKPHFLTQELTNELNFIDLTPYSPMRDLKRIVPLNKNLKINNTGLKIINFESKENIFEDVLKVSIGEKIGLDKYDISIKNISFEEKFNDSINDNPFFKLKNFVLKSKEVKRIESLVLWDIENVNFNNDISKITSKLKSDNQLKVVSYYRKNKADKTIFYQGDIYNKLKGLKKKNWIVKTSKENADTILIDSYYKYKDTLKELIIISGDSDFKDIAENAISLNIAVKILNNSNFKSEKWFNTFNYEKIN